MIVAVTGMWAQKNGAPDFAYPRQVEKDADAAIRKALERDDAPALLEGAVQWSLAKTQVSSDSIPPVLARLEQLQGAVSDAAAKAMLTCLRATIYTRAYRNNRYVYDRREYTAGAGEDFTLWSKENFASRVDSLTMASMMPQEALLATPATIYSGVIDFRGADATLYPTLYDFIGMRGADNLQAFVSGENTLNEALLTDCDNSRLYPPVGTPAGDILRIYRSLGRSADSSLRAPAQVNYVLTLMEFINDHAFRTSEGGDAYNEALMREYHRFLPYTDSAVRFLLATDGDYKPRELYEELLRFKKEHPAYADINAVTNRINSLSRKNVELAYPSMAVPGTPFTVKVAASNVHELTVVLYDVTSLVPRGDSGLNLRKYGAQLGKAVDSRTISLSGDVPFQADTTVTFTIPKFGRYLLVAEADGLADNKTNWIQAIYATAIAPAVLEPSPWLVAANPLTGEPQKGVQFSFRPWSRNTGFNILPGSTGTDGLLKADVNKDGGDVLAQRGDDRYGPRVNIYGLYEASLSENLDVELLTPLSLYHPGDTVRWAAAAFAHDGKKTHAIAANRKIRLTLYDANGQEQGKSVATTDEWGRAEGYFILPPAGLQGRFSIRATYTTAKNEDNYGGEVWFTVSDYRLPTFRVEEVAARAPKEGDEAGVISGKALTFAGFPVADAKVDVQLKVRTGLWFWARTSPVFASLKGTTDTDGNFSIPLPVDLLNGSPAPDGVFLASVTVTSPDGETHEGSAQFNRGKPLAINTDIPAVIDLSKPFKASVNTLDYKGEKVDSELTYTLSGSDAATTFKEVTGTVKSGSVSRLLERLPAGSYTARFATADSTLAAPAENISFILYRPDARISPVKSLLWVPGEQTVADADGKAEIVFGSDTDGAWIWLAVTDDEARLIENRWLRSRKGMQTLTVNLPANAKKVKAQLNAIRDYKSFSENITLLPVSSQKKIALKIETFRDRVTPGDLETVTFRILPTAGADPRSAVMASMTNMAIDQLAPGSLKINIRSAQFRSTWLKGWDLNTDMSYWKSPYNYLPTLNYDAPRWDFYGVDFFPGFGSMYNVQIRGTKRALAMKAESAETESVEEVAFDAAAPMMAAGATADDGGVLNEVVATEPVDESGEQKSETNDDSYRPSEIPMAFFRPMLTTADNGSLELTYRVPDANTTWILRAVAYNRELLQATASADIVASKPLMVNLNAPRFLRSGDRITIPTSVMNATDSVCSPSGKIEIIDQASGKVLAAKDFNLAGIAPRGQATVALDYEANTLTAALVVRVKATAGNHTDGEQELVAVLPAQQDVMESRIFYIPADTARFTMQLPALAPDGKAMLNFTENPTWQVVSALPGLREGNIDSSIEAAHALFSAAVARGLVQRYPEVARTLRRWSEHPADSALVSPLQSDSELRKVLLSATPWVQEALSDTQRLQRLALLLDRKECDKVTAEAIELLAKTSASGGGWYWTARYPEVSEWATTEVLMTLGQLNRMGWLPDDSRLARMTEGACRWLDAETARQFTKYPESDYSLYTYLRTLFPAIKQSTASQRVSNATVQRCIAKWKEYSLQGKALSTLVLSAKGYAATARQIVASLSEFATSTPEKGMWWQQLDHTTWNSLDRVGVTSVILQAYNAVQPKSKEVDRIRQWLVLQKQNTDWGSSAVTSLVVASILSTGSEWTVNPTGTAIHIGDVLLQPDKTRYATGEFTADISADLTAPAVMVIDRQANYPSVGSVVTMERRPMQAVKAVGCAEATIEKSMKVYRDGQWAEASAFRPGDRVRVTLTITADDDLDYLVVTDPRPAGFEPAEQLPEPVWSDGTCFYRENRDSSTNLYIDHLRRGSYILSYELYAAQQGVYTSGAAELQSQYNPIVTAHSSGSVITVNTDE